MGEEQKWRGEGKVWEGKKWRKVKRGEGWRPPTPRGAAIKTFLSSHLEITQMVCTFMIEMVL